MRGCSHSTRPTESRRSAADRTPWARRNQPNSRSIPAAVALHAPNAIRPLDKAIGLGGSRVAENLGVVNRIDPDQAARDHIPAFPATVVVFPRGCGGTENAERSGDCNHDESLVSPHGNLLPVIADYLMVDRVSRQPYGHFSGGLQ